MLLLWLLLLLSSTARIQKILVDYASNFFYENYHTKVAVGSVYFRFFNRIELRDVYVEDLQHDTLLYIASLNAKFIPSKWWKNDFKIQSVDFKNAYLNIYRSAAETTFNYQFILDQLPKDSMQNTGSNFSLQSMNAMNIRVVYRDLLERVKFENTIKKIGINQINFQGKETRFNVKSVVIDELDIKVAQLRKLDFNYIIPTESISVKNIKGEAGSPFSISIENLLVHQSNYAYDNNNYEQVCNNIDYAHLWITQSDAFIQDLIWTQDALNLKLKKLNFEEQSGFSLKQMNANVNITQNAAVFEALNILTPKSEIHDYFAMYFDSWNDFSHFTHLINLNAKFDNSKIHLKDINYFVPGIENMEHNVFLFSGNIRGTIDNLKAKQLKVKAGLATRYQGDIHLIGLPNIRETFISLNSDKSIFNALEVQQIYTGLVLPEAVKSFGNTFVSGHFDGFYNDFVANASIVSQAGIIHSDLNLKFSTDWKEAEYKGFIAAEDLYLRKILNDTLFGKATFEGRIAGKNFNIKTVDNEIDIAAKKFDYNGYTYNNLKLNGSFLQNSFVGKSSINDQNLKLTFNGNADFTELKPYFNFDVQLEKANLKALHFSKDEIEIATQAKFNFSGTTIDEMSGFLEVFNTHIFANKKNYTIENISLETMVFEDEGTKRITLESDFGNLEVKGNINFKNLPKTLQFFFNTYFKKASLISADEDHIDLSQNFNFYFNINKAMGDITELISPQLKALGITNIAGSFNSTDNQLKIDGNIDYLRVANMELKKITLKSRGTTHDIYMRIITDSLMINDSLFTQNINLFSHLKNDNIRYKLAIQDTSNKNYLRLNGNIETDLKKISNQFSDSSIVQISNKNWNIFQNGSFQFDGKNLNISPLLFANSSDTIISRTFITKDSTTNLSIHFNDVMLLDLLSLIPQISSLKIQGSANGNIMVYNLLQQPTPSANLTVDSLTIHENMFGNLRIGSVFDDKNMRFSFDADLQSTTNNVAIKGFYNLKESNKDELQFSMNAQSLDLSMANPFLKGIIANTEGIAAGQLKLNGTFQKPELTGKLMIKEAKSTIDFLKIDVHLKEEEVEFLPNEINIGEIIIHDRFDHELKASGTIKHQNLQKFYFDIQANTDEFEMMNISSAAAREFFGQAFGKAKILIKGPLHQLVFNIKATTLKGTKVGIAIADSKDVNEYTFYRFVDKKSAAFSEERMYQKEKSGVEFNIDLTATPDAQVDLILSNEEGDIISARGEGNLKLNYDMNGELSIIGVYTILEGEYYFTMQNIISKRFIIDKGSQIVWAGSPYSAKLGITAKYTLRASPYDLVEDIVKGSNDRLQQARIRVLVNLLLNIGGSITSPDISFDIKIPDADPGIKTAVNSKLDFIKLEQSELDKQVVGLLVLNKFLPIYAIGTNSTGADNVVNGVNNTVSEFVSNQLSNYLSDWVSKFITEVQLDVNYRTYQTGTGEPDVSNNIDNRREFQLALSKSFLNDRLYIDIGGNFDFAGNTSSNNDPNTPKGNNVAGDFELQYAIMPDGRLKLKVFRRGEYDIFTERNRNKTGLGLQYKKEFNDLKELVSPSENAVNRRTKRRQKNLKFELK